MIINKITAGMQSSYYHMDNSELSFLNALINLIFW